MNPTVSSPAVVEANVAALTELRRELKEKFAEAHRDYRPRESILSGVRWIDDAGGLPKGELCEISLAPGAAMSGGAVVIGQMLRHVIRQRQRLVLIDGADAFDPSVFSVLENDTPLDLDGSFVWARCRGVKEAVRVADMILRDGNLPRTVIDLQASPVREIRAIPKSSWLRLHKLTEDSGMSCVIMTPEPMMNCAGLRFEITSRFDPDDFESPELAWESRNRGQLCRVHRR